ncbi:MFS transporter [Marinivivus vitaminiproducens]|uniref:MFS transporter n=1 Tax=Marinivivus vitaminiproducens TaxID=3035935 RepID=UPI003F9FBF5C
MPPALFALAAGAFGIGTTEFVVMGLLPQVAQDLGVTIPSAGLIVSGYAAGVVVGAPVLAILTNRLPRKATLIGLMLLFALGNLLCAIAPTYGLLMAARVLTAFAHAAFFGIGAIVAADLVPYNQRAQAMSLMFAGLTLANVLGVPGGTALGQVAGWRSAFVLVAAIGVIAALGIGLLVPRSERPAGSGILREFGVLRDPQVVIGMAMSALSAGSLFAVFTYITPLLETVTGIAPGNVTLYLLLYGAGLTVGNLIGGRLADWKLMPSMMVLLTLLAVILATFTWTSQFPGLALATMIVWGMVGFALVSPLQMRVIDKARRAPNLASTLNQGAFNVGCASGAFLGGIPLTLGYGYAMLPWVSVVLVLATLALCVLSAALDQRQPADCVAAAA